MSGRYERIVRDPDLALALTKEEIKDLLLEAGKVFELEQNLIPLGSGRAIFVGDTHGDFDATKRVIAKHPIPENKVVFLGDYVDRGPQSMANINYLLSLKLAYPQNLFLLMGNHEAYGIMPFYPADFWQQLDGELSQLYASLLLKLPLAVSTSNGVIALHGALPDVGSVEAINEIEIGSEEWRQITWGDWQEGEGSFLGDDPFSGRPQFGEDYFNDIMARLGKRVLIRSHQPTAPAAMFGRRCLTIFTSSAYMPLRTIALLDLSREMHTVDDLPVERV